MNAVIARLVDDGVPIKEIVRRTGRSRKLVRQVIRSERTDFFRIRQSSLEAHLPMLDEMWNAGCRDGAELWRRLEAKSYRGSLRVVGEWTTCRRAERASDRQLRKVPSARTIAYLMTTARDHLSKSDTVPYGSWRWLHVGLAVLGFAAAIAHVLGVGHFTATPQSRALWLGVTLGWIGILAWTRLVVPAVQRANPWRVSAVEEERGGAVSLTCSPLRRGLPAWQPGQFVWLTLGSTPFGLGEHPFTIASPPEAAPHVTLTVRPLGGFSERLAGVQPGVRAYLHGPFGTFSIDNDADAVGFVMIAGGIGITPMIANLRAMRARRDCRPVVLVYANRDWESVAFREELAEMEAALELKIVHVLEKAPESWTGEAGMVTRELLARHLPKTTLPWPHFLCGPPPMVDAAKDHLQSLGVPLRHVDSEIFDMV